jgi:hypothetical protein
MSGAFRWSPGILAVGVALSAVVGAAIAVSPDRAEWQSPAGFTALERTFDSLRYLRDQLDVTRSRGASRSIHGIEVSRLAADYGALRQEFEGSLATVRGMRLRRADRAALAAMTRAFRETLGPDRGTSSVTPTREARCDYHASAVARLAGGRDSLQALVFGCYSAATQGIVVDGDTLDRLSILGLLGTTEDRSRRERLFRSLDRVWRTVNGHDEPTSPFRQLVPLRRLAWGRRTPMAERAAGLGLSAIQVEEWLEAALVAWRATLPDTVLEPWDFHFHGGAMSRRLSARVPRESLLVINHRYYRALGADPPALNIQYDLEPRPGKYPIAFSTFGARNVQRAGIWTRGEPWVFASYRIGGVDNLGELLHETGHAIHLAAIRVRPAFHDWPDSDTFTEGIADAAGLELYEPAWQRAFLGDSAGLPESIRAKYAGVVLDMAWALFELRVHRAGAASPNQVWNEITSRYLGIRPYPELSWWAMRGQLIQSPGYMMNYALGAFLIADLRRAAAGKLGSPTTGNPRWYSGMAEAFYRHGSGKPARQLIEDFLGRPLSPKALLEDLARIRR